LEKALNKKLVVLTAVNGGARQDREGAKVPVSPAEITEAAYDCYKAGARLRSRSSVVGSDAPHALLRK
jgi:hypothetical protein